MADVGLYEYQHLPPWYYTDLPTWPAYIDLGILESLFQIIVDSLVRYFAYECEIRDSDFLLFRTLEDGLLDLGLSSAR